MSENENELDLKIPDKVSDHQYVIQGIGKTELTILSVVLLVSIGIVITCVFNDRVGTGMMIAAVLLSTSFFLLFRDNTNENLIDKFKIIFNYLKMQKRYYYIFFDIYSDMKDTDYGEKGK